MKKALGLIGALVGAAGIGAALGLLFAPSSGKRLRRQLAVREHVGERKVRRLCRRLHSQARTIYIRALQGVQHKKDS